MSWPSPTALAVFAERRRRLLGLLDGPAVLPAGLPRARNLPTLTYPFRANSHFLYLVGAQLPGALLRLSGSDATLYVEPPCPSERLWGGSPSLEQLATARGIGVRPLADLPRQSDAAVLPSPDQQTNGWLAALLGRAGPSPGAPLEGADAALADALIEVRLCHDDAALAQIRQAVDVTVEAHLEGMARTRVGGRTAQVLGAMTGHLEANGMVHAYEPIVTVRGEVLHDTKRDALMDANALVLADVGGETPEGWAADLTRTWPVKGAWSASQKDLYGAVLAAHEAAVLATRPGAWFRDVHHAAQQRLVACLCELGILRGDPMDLWSRGAAALFFPHGVGHLLGLDVHDLEDLGDRAGYAPGRQRSDRPGERYLRLDRQLRPGMVVTIEPGFYRLESLFDGDPQLLDAIDQRVLSRFGDVRGIRIEDDVLVTPQGCEVLSEALPRAPDGLEAAIDDRGA